MAISDQNEIFVDTPAKVFDRGPFVGVDPQFQVSGVGVDADDLEPDPAVEIRAEREAEAERTEDDDERAEDKSAGTDGTKQGADPGDPPTTSKTPAPAAPSPTPAPVVAPAPAPPK